MPCAGQVEIFFRGQLFVPRTSRKAYHLINNHSVISRASTRRAKCWEFAPRLRHTMTTFIELIRGNRKATDEKLDNQSRFCHISLTEGDKHILGRGSVAAYRLVVRFENGHYKSTRYPLCR